MADDTKDKAADPATPTAGQPLREKPARGVLWAHQPGCTNPANAKGEEDWNCPCGPTVIKG